VQQEVAAQAKLIADPMNHSARITGIVGSAL
jgi:hypothetical protein